MANILRAKINYGIGISREQGSNVYVFSNRNNGETLARLDSGTGYRKIEEYSPSLYMGYTENEAWLIRGEIYEICNVLTTTDLQEVTI